MEEGAMDVRVDPDGSLRVPAEVCRELGWEAGAEVAVEALVDRVVLRRAAAVASPAASFKERVREFAESVRQLPGSETVRELVSSLSAPGPAAGAAPRATLIPFHGQAPVVPASCYVA